MGRKLDERLAGLIADFAARYDERAALGWVHDFWQSDLPSDFTAFWRTANYAAEELRRLGADEVEIVELPADGRTRMQSWTMPLAWEAGESILRIVSPQEEVLCDRATQPLSSVMWSEPTPAGGVRGPLVLVDDPAQVSAAERQALRGSFILTRRGPGGKMKLFAAEVGAAAVVTCFNAQSERHPEALGWVNNWADDEGGWALLADEHRMTGFVVSPTTGQRLRNMLTGGPVTCEARVGGRVGPGRLPVVTAVLPGRSPEEILLVGHLFEIGVIDNASGGGAMMEALRLMAGMATPRRRVRILLTSECYGTYGFYSRRSDLLKHLLAGLNLDGVGNPESAERPTPVQMTSEAAPSAADTLFRAAMRLTENFPGARPAKLGPHSLSDNMMCDPAAGGAGLVGVIKSPWHWHTSSDDWSGLSADAVRRVTVAAAAYVRWLAEAGAAEADDLAEAVAEDAAADFPEGGALGETRRTFFLDRARVRILWTARLGGRRAAELAARLPELDLAGLVQDRDGGVTARESAEARTSVPVRRFWGAPTFDGIPEAERDGFTDPRWAMLYVTACYWADGRRTVAEIAALVRTEFDHPMPDLLRFFRVLERGGLVEMRTADEAGGAGEE